MSEPKKHHIVPRMLLKHFALDGKICLYSKKSESFRFDQGIENVCIQKNFYGEKSIIEQYLAIVESKSTESLENFKNKPESISQQDRVNIAEFLGCMVLRTKHMEAFIAEIERSTIETGIIDFISNPQNLRSEEEKEYAKELKKNGFKDFTVTIPRDLIVARSFNPDLVNAVSSTIYQMNWVLLEAPNDYFFILGDTVIIRTVPSETLMGLSNSDLMLAIPLSPKLLLMADWKKDKKIKKAIMFPQAVEHFNAQSILWASEEVFFNTDQYDKIQSLVQRCSKDKIIFDYKDVVSASQVKVERK